MREWLVKSEAVKRRQILTGRRTLGLLHTGTREVAKLVETTFGPHGGKVAVSKLGTVVVTTDGASLLREAQFGDMRRLGASLVRSASLAVEKNVGDCTTTTVLLTEAILRIALGDGPSDRWDPVKMVTEIRESLVEAQVIISEMATPATPDMVGRVGFMATHGDPVVTNPVLESLLLAGENGTVVLAEWEGTGVEVDHREGMTLTEGWASHAFSDGESERVMDGPMVAVSSQALLTAKDVQGMLEAASQWPGRGLVVFAPAIMGEALTTMILNQEKKVVPSIAVSYRGQRQHLSDWLEDLAATTNATVVGRESGQDLSKWDDTWLGYARKVSVRKDRTVVVSYMDEPIIERVDNRVKSLFLRAEQSTHDYDRDRLRERASSLDGGVCTIKIGGFTKQEAQDRRSRAEDALYAMRAALKGGVVAGAGTALFRASLGLPDTQGGYVLAMAMQDPLRILAVRAGSEPEVIVDRVLDAMGSQGDCDWMGWDPVTDTWRDFREGEAIIDPVAGTLAALEAAVSVATQILLTGAVICEDRR